MIANTLHDPLVINRLRRLPGLRATDGDQGDRPAVKLFDPTGQAFWVLWEYDHEQELAFGLCDLGLGFPELGYVSIDELKQLPGLPIEQDRSVQTLVEGYESRSLEPPTYLVSRDKETRV